MQDYLHTFHVAITAVIRAFLVVAIVSGALNGRWVVVFVSCLAFFFTFAPSIFMRNSKIQLPVELEFVMVLFIFASLFLGEVQGYYTRFWWWDSVLHTGSGVVLGFIGFLIMYVLDKGHKLKTGPFWMALFSFSFALAIGALWEIVEFTIDGTFGTNMQRTGLVDTMWDLIVDACGALFAAIVGYFYQKGETLGYFDRIMTKFVEKNQWLFK